MNSLHELASERANERTRIQILASKAKPFKGLNWLGCFMFRRSIKKRELNCCIEWWGTRRQIHKEQSMNIDCECRCWSVEMGIPWSLSLTREIKAIYTICVFLAPFTSRVFLLSDAESLLSFIVDPGRMVEKSFHKAIDRMIIFIIFVPCAAPLRMTRDIGFGPKWNHPHLMILILVCSSWLYSFFSLYRHTP